MLASHALAYLTVAEGPHGVQNSQVAYVRAGEWCHARILGARGDVLPQPELPPHMFVDQLDLQSRGGVDWDTVAP